MNKWSNIAFGEDIGIIEIEIRTLSWALIGHVKYEIFKLTSFKQISSYVQAYCFKKVFQGQYSTKTDNITATVLNNVICAMYIYVDKSILLYEQQLKVYIEPI